MPTNTLGQEEYFKVLKKGQKLLKFDKNGKLYFPALIRQIFHGYHFYLEIEDGKIVLDPVKVDDVGLGGRRRE